MKICLVVLLSKPKLEILIFVSSAKWKLLSSRYIKMLFEFWLQSKL